MHGLEKIILLLHHSMEKKHNIVVFLVPRTDIMAMLIYYYIKYSGSRGNGLFILVHRHEDRKNAIFHLFPKGSSILVAMRLEYGGKSEHQN